MLLLLLFGGLLSGVAGDGDEPFRVVVKCKSVEMIIPMIESAPTVKSLLEEVNKRVHKKLKESNDRVVDLSVDGSVLDEDDELLDILQVCVHVAATMMLTKLDI